MQEKRTAHSRMLLQLPSRSGGSAARSGGDGARHGGQRGEEGEDAARGVRGDGVGVGGREAARGMEVLGDGCARGGDCRMADAVRWQVPQLRRRRRRCCARGEEAAEAEHGAERHGGSALVYGIAPLCSAFYFYFLKELCSASDQANDGKGKIGVRFSPLRDWTLVRSLFKLAGSRKSKLKDWNFIWGIMYAKSTLLPQVSLDNRYTKI
jgi:hypothetical protein